MSYIDDKLKEIENIINESKSEVKIASDNSYNDMAPYEKEILKVANEMIKISNNQNITIEDLRNFLYKKGDSSMDKETLLKAASIIRATAEFVKNQRLQKEAEAKNIISEKLQRLGVEVEEDKIDKIAKNQDIIDVLKKVSYDVAPRVGEGEKAEGIGSGVNAEERFLRWLGL